MKELHLIFPTLASFNLCLGTKGATGSIMWAPTKKTPLLYTTQTCKIWSFASVPFSCKNRVDSCKNDLLIFLEDIFLNQLLGTA